MHLKSPRAFRWSVEGRRSGDAPRPAPRLLYVPFPLIALAAVAGLIALLVLHRDVGRLSEEIVGTGRPARELLGEIQVAFSRRIYTLQEYLLTGDERYLSLYQREAVNLGELRRRLRPLLDRLAVDAATQQEFARSLASWNLSLDQLVSTGSEPGTFEENAGERDALHAETLAVMSALRDEINASISARLQQIRANETIQVLIAITLAALALIAATERTRIALLEREARGEAERRARAEAALRGAAAAVASAQTVEETVRRIVESALTSMGAEAALVERIDADAGQVEIVARRGTCGPALHDRFDYTDSVSRLVVEEQGPVQWNAPGGRDTTATNRYDRAECEGMTVLAVPLIDSDTALGSLILLRSGGGRTFDGEETERLRSFGDLAALEFRRMILLAESERRRKELERVTESRARLLRGFTHDVKNALGAADGYAQLLEVGVVGAPSAEQRVGIGRLRASIQGALKLTEDLLHLARVESGHIQIEWRTTDVGEIAESVTDAYRPQAESKGIELTLEIKDVAPLRTDPDRIHQVLGNLISNAVKYTPAGGHIRVIATRGQEMAAPRPGSWLSVSVIDDGPGIPEEQQSFVFDEFVRLSPDLGAGSGLGLAISRHVARALKGDLTVGGAPGSGCVFTLWLPLQS